MSIRAFFVTIFRLLLFTGSCVTQGGTASYKKKLKYSLTNKCPNRHKNLDY